MGPVAGWYDLFAGATRSGAAIADARTECCHRHYLPKLSWRNILTTSLQHNAGSLLRGGPVRDRSRIASHLVTKLYLSGDPEADQLLSEDPLALLVGMVLDQQIPLERAFSAPRDLRRRLGNEDGPLDPEVIASMAPDKLAEVFAERPALHRFPSSNAQRVQQLCQIVTDQYGGVAARVWEQAKTGKELFQRVQALPGFGQQKAKIFVALLGKQMGVRPPGWREACRPFGDAGTTYSVADITSSESLAKVRAYKADMKRAAKAAAGQA